MTLAIRSSDTMAKASSFTETDTIPRIRLRDLVSAIQFVGRTEAPTLESLRVKLNADRRTVSGGTAGYSVARDTASELDRLGLALVGPLPKDAKGFEKKRNSVIKLNEHGRELADKIQSDRAAAYNQLMIAFFEAHPYFRRYVLALVRGPFLAPVVTSAKHHISQRYGNAKTLADDVAAGRFELSSLIEVTEKRLKRALDRAEASEITDSVEELVKKLRPAADTEPQTEFARKMLMAINEIVVPATLRKEGLGFDFNSLRRMWLMGKEFQTSWATSAHPMHDAWLTFATAKVVLNADQSRIEALKFESGIRALSNDFLERLFEAYALMQSWGQPSVVTAWELRAVFCFQNECSPRAFDHLFLEYYGGSDTYRIEKDFVPTNKPTHEEGLKIGGREIGLIRISKR